MKDHVVSEQVISEDISRIFPNLRRSDYLTFECSEDNSKIHLKVPVLIYPTPVNKLKKKQNLAELCQGLTLQAA